MKGRRPNLDTIKRRLAGQPYDGPPPECPTWLDEDAREEWDRVVPLLGATLQPADAVMLAAYCQGYSTWMRAERQVRLDGLMIDGARGPMLHPCARHASTLLAELRRCAAEFGLTPSSRSRVDAPAKTSGEQDEFHDFLGEE